MLEFDRLETTFENKKVVIENGKVAKQADGAIWMQLNDTVVLSTVCYDKNASRDLDFFPLTVEYREKSSAAGKFPGGFFKRETRPSSGEILCSRIVDRSIRPLFPEGFKSEVQVIINVMSYDQVTPPDVLAVNATSLALCISPIPFMCPVAAVRVALFKHDGEFVVNPNDNDLNNAVLELFVSGTRERIVMIEAGANEVSNETFIKSLKFAHEKIIQQIAIQEEFIKMSRNKKEKAAFEVAKIDENFKKEVYDYFFERCNKALRVFDKLERGNAVAAAVDECYKNFIAKAGLSTENKEHKADIEELKKKIKPIFEEVEYDVVREMILKEKIRVDGRKINEIRQITCETSLLPRTHGSALFTRGQTQSLSTVTLGTKKDEQIVESLLEEDTRQKFMLHYNFPPFATGEVKPLRGVGRREIGHGALAEKSLSYMIPGEDVFPYTVRIISEILESNGSSSMASICAGSLALMDAGVPVKKAVAGIAMGLITRGEEWEVLTDIAGIEDHCGDMDFKIGGTKDGITGVQLDVKINGLTMPIIEKTVMQAFEGRLHILGIMEKAIAAPRQAISQYAPRITTLQVDTDKIREIIGPGGKMIRSIVEATGAEIDIDDTGKVSIVSVDLEKSQKAIKMITDLVKEVEAGEVYTGKVTRIMNFGAFVEVLPGKEGLVHISELAWTRTEKVEDVCKIGDEMKVKVIEIDNMGRINLSRKELLERPAQPEGSPDAPQQSAPRPAGPRPNRDNRGGGGFNRDRGPRR